MSRSSAAALPAPSHEGTSSIRDLAVCITCGVRLAEDLTCSRCGHSYAFRDGILETIGPLSGRNRIVAAFYDGPGWRRFHRWEQGFLILQGGVRRARMQILRHVLQVNRPDVLSLEVGIGDGENLPLLPSGWSVHGVDIARNRLEACRARHPSMSGRLAWAEAECLPFADATFEACWTLGGFTYFRDHETALREMRRVTKPAGPVIVADEIPGLQRAGLGHLIGLPAFDAWWLRGLGLDREFVDMALSFDVDLDDVVRRVWPEALRQRIWYGMGYCWVHRGE
jgi:SAM-dependent methyltransferase